MGSGIYNLLEKQTSLGTAYTQPREAPLPEPLDLTIMGTRMERTDALLVLATNADVYNRSSQLAEAESSAQVTQI